LDASETVVGVVDDVVSAFDVMGVVHPCLPLAAVIPTTATTTATKAESCDTVEFVTWMGAGCTVKATDTDSNNDSNNDNNDVDADSVVGDDVSVAAVVNAVDVLLMPIALPKLQHHQQQQHQQHSNSPRYYNP